MQQAAFALWLCLFSGMVAAASIEQSISTEQQTSAAGRQSQQQVDRLARDSEQLLREYQQLMQQGDYQQAYNLELERRLEEQQQELARLQQDIADVQITRLHVMPLLRDMSSGLKQFVELDLPFEQQQRLASVARLEQLLAGSSTSLAEKFRRVLEAWQAESDYSYQLGSWRGEVLVQDMPRRVDFLRVGRLALYYQTPDGQQSAWWDRQAGQWQPLASAYNHAIRQGIRLADKQLPPQLLQLPIASQAVQP